MMFTRRYLHAFALAGMLAGIVPGESYGAAPPESQLFPPGQPGTTMANIESNLCGSTQGQNYTYTLVWDGQSPVWCSQVPTNCPSGTGLNFDNNINDKTYGDFVCANPCEPTPEAVAGQCPSGEVLVSGGMYELNYCDNSFSAPFGTPPVCGPPQTQIPAIGTYPCTPGSPLVGSYVSVGGSSYFQPGGSTVVGTCP